MIRYDAKEQIFKLDTPHTSYVMGLADGKWLGHCYYGARLEDTRLRYLLRTEEYPYTPATNAREKVSFLEYFPMEYPCGGAGDFRESALEVENSVGQIDVELEYRSHRILEGKPKLNGLPATWGEDCDTLEITLIDPLTGLEVILCYTAFRDLDVITRSVRLSHKGDSSLYLRKVMSSSLNIDTEGPEEAITLHGAWARERQIERKSLGFGSMVVESLRGETGHQDHPFVALVRQETTQTSGAVYGMNLVYSGNFLTKVQKSQFGQLRAVMGIHPDRFRWKLEPGEQFQAPEAVMVYTEEGLGGMSRIYHRLYRKHLIRSPWKDRERPVLINNWEATYFDFDTEKLLSIAKEAKSCGIEMLVMDDGWFGHRNSDKNSLGDWFVNEEKLPGGLKPLVDQINALGMRFGIWMEPEMISPDSEICREHPEWVMGCNDRTSSLSREQWVLDLCNPQVEEYVYQQIQTVLHSANIEYMKWDMNRPLTQAGSRSIPSDRQGEIMHRYMLAVYRLQERMLQEFPELLLENCSGGGGRFDPGMLYYSPQIWCSDNADAIDRLMIQEGTSLVYPLSAMGAHVSDCPNHTVGRVTPFATRGNVALTGTFGYELDVTKISEEERKQIPEQIARYKQYHQLLCQGEYYRIASYQDNHHYDCYQVMNPEQTKGIVVYVQVIAEPNGHNRRIRLQGLRSDVVYQIQDRQYWGSTLMQAGLILDKLWGDFQSVIVEIKAEA